MRGERGQGTVEYVAVVLLVAGVLAAVVAAVTVTGIGPRVAREMRCAVLFVTGEPCDALPAVALGPCVTASDRHAHGRRVSVLFVGAGTRKVLLREERSDGTVAITLIDERAGGPDAGAGAGVSVRWGTFDRAIGTELRAAVMAGSAAGRTWIAQDAAQAETLTARVRVAEVDFARERFPAPEPQITFAERMSATEIRLGNARHALRLSPAEAYGERIDHATGRRTVYVRDTVDGRAQLAYGGGHAQASGEAEERYGITFDREGRPVDLVVLSTLWADGAATLPRHLARIAGRLRVHGARHIETERHLDLTRPANAEVVRGFLGRFGTGKVAIGTAARLLADRLHRDGTLSVRSYETRASAHGVAGRVPGVSAEIGSEDESSRLVSAVARTPGGRWGEDAACRPPA